MRQSQLLRGENPHGHDNYLQILSNNAPGDHWTVNEKKAFWINAYNAFTIQLICENYPISSIKDIGGDIPRYNTPWDIEFISIGDFSLDLNTIEHDILRKEFNDPRIHFAINCASRSCPSLLTEAYSPEHLDSQLNQSARTFLLDTTKNDLSDNALLLSPIFKWFKVDFGDKESLIDLLKSNTDIQISNEASIDYLPYDWSLNDQNGENSG